jgi:hypothetical protein
MSDNQADQENGNKKYKSGIETLRISGTDEQSTASFTVPKQYLMQVSPVFHRMFTAEMTEKAFKIEGTSAEEFSDFLKAISPKQEHPNRKISFH